MSQDDMNTGFEEAEDFVEPEFSSDIDNQVLDKANIAETLFGYEPGSFRNEFVSNALRSFAIHTVLCVAGILLLLIAGTLGMLVNAIGAVVSYTLLSRKFLTPLPQGNLLSVSMVSILLATIFCSYHILTHINASEVLTLLNFPAIALVHMALLPVGALLGMDELIYAESSSLIMLVAAFIPSLFMYLGLRLKMGFKRREDY